MDSKVVILIATLGSMGEGWKGFGARPAWRVGHPPRMTDSEVEFVDIVLVELERIAQHHSLVGADGEFAKLPGGELVAFVALDFASDHRLGRVGSEVAEVGWIPQGELLHSAVLDVFPHLVRCSKSGKGHLALGL